MVEDCMSRQGWDPEDRDGWLRMWGGMLFRCAQLECGDRARKNLSETCIGMGVVVGGIRQNDLFKPVLVPAPIVTISGEIKRITLSLGKCWATKSPGMLRERATCPMSKVEATNFPARGMQASGFIQMRVVQAQGTCNRCENHVTIMVYN